MRYLEKRGCMNDRIDVALNKFRSRVNSFPPGLCPLALYRSILQMSMNQSCGKCVPCRDGLQEADRLLGSILSGDATEETLTELRSLCETIAATADCAVGVVAATTVLDSMAEFADEYESHIHARRCVEPAVQTVPCMTLCPAHVDVPAYVALIREGDCAGAVQVIRDRNPFPTACAMVCEHPCERKCRRSIIDAPINIRGLKKYAVDQVAADTVADPAANAPTGKCVAVIGGGPSGMTAAYFLARMGHSVDLYDEHDMLGGMLRYGIPESAQGTSGCTRDTRWGATGIMPRCAKATTRCIWRWARSLATACPSTAMTRPASPPRRNSCWTSRSTAAICMAKKSSSSAAATWRWTRRAPPCA